MKIDGKEVSLYEENHLDNLIKAGLVTTAVTSALFLSPVPMKAAGWRANSPEEIAARIDYDQQSLTFESGDTVWNLGAALNIKNPMDLLTYNHYQPGDEYYLPVGTIIYWDKGHLVIKDPEGTVIGDKMITEHDKQNPNQPIPLEVVNQKTSVQKYHIDDQITYDIAHQENISSQNNVDYTLIVESKNDSMIDLFDPLSESTSTDSDRLLSNHQSEQAQQKINALLSKKSTIELEIARVSADIVDIEEEIQNRKSMNMQLVNQYMVRDQELNMLQQEINDYIINQLTPKQEQLTEAIQEKIQALESFEHVNLIFKNIQDQLQELEVQQKVADIAVQQLKEQVFSFPVTDDQFDEFLQKKNDYEYQVTLKTELEAHRAQLMIQFLAYDELYSEQKKIFEEKNIAVIFLEQEVEDYKRLLEMLEKEYHQVNLGYQQQKLEIQQLDLEPLLQQLTDKRNLLIRLEKKLVIINKELNDLYTLYRPAGNSSLVLEEQEHIISDDLNSHVPDLAPGDVEYVLDQPISFIPEHNQGSVEDLENHVQDNDALDLIFQEQEDNENMSGQHVDVSILNEQQMLDVLDQLFNQNKITSRQYMDGIGAIQDASTLSEKISKFKRIQSIADANGKKPQQVSKETFMRLLNEYRQKQGLSQLKLDNTLSAAAEVRANEITQKFDHKRPNGALFNTVLDRTESVAAYSENIAIAHTFDNNGIEIAEYLFDAWQKSPLHDKNLRTINNTRIGFAYVQGSDGLYYAVLLFGTLKK